MEETEADDEEIEDPISEQKALEQSSSSFRDHFQSIYDAKLNDCAVFAAKQYRSLTENPYFNPTYHKRILSLYLPASPIWSNLMMGNLSRFGYHEMTEPVEHCGCHNSRTTGLSESRMKLVKKTFLAVKSLRVSIKLLRNLARLFDK